MRRNKVAVTIDAELLLEVDSWVGQGDFPSRSQAVESGLARLREERASRRSLLGELAKLEPAEERAMAEEWLDGEIVWPECGLSTHLAHTAASPPESIVGEDLAGAHTLD